MPEEFDDLRLDADAARVATGALAEDGARDLSSEVSVSSGQWAVGRIEARESMVIAGLRYADAVVAASGLPPITWHVAENAALDAPAVIGTIEGSLRSILRAERPLLNLLQRACGIASLTRRYVDAVAGTGCRVLHTRKTTPGLRLFEVAAVLAGGGARHRLDLATTVMIKDNHWQALAASGRTLEEALAEAMELGSRGVHVEVETLEQLEIAVAAGATRLLIDNQSAATVQAWGALARALRPRIEIEATGGITLATIRSYAEAGADFVSTGALTHSVAAADLGLEVS